MRETIFFSLKLLVVDKCRVIAYIISLSTVSMFLVTNLAIFSNIFALSVLALRYWPQGFRELLYTELLY